jgi:hypothetical protein
MQLTIFTKYTYTLETIIQAGKKGLTIQSVPIRTNPPLRTSRLITSNWNYIKRNAVTILRLYTFYEPLRTFFYLSVPFLLIGIFLIGRFLYFHFSGGLEGPARLVQSLVIGSTSLILGFLIFILGVIADLIAANRFLSEKTIYELRRLGLNYQVTDIPHLITFSEEPLESVSSYEKKIIQRQ